MPALNIHALQQRVSLFQLLLRMSRACLGKYSGFKQLYNNEPRAQKRHNSAPVRRIYKVRIEAAEVNDILLTCKGRQRESSRGL